MFKSTLFVLVVLALSLRVLFIPQGAVSFHYDMARDAFEAQRIWKDYHLKILGPPTSTPGLYHGVLYYYLIAPFYGLGQGDPRLVAVFLSFVNSLAVIPIFLLAKDLFKNNIWAAVSGLLYVVSFESTQYGPWLSNPGPAMLTVALFFYFLRLWQKGKDVGLYLATLSAAASTQFQFFLIYLFLLLPIFRYIFKIRTNSKQVITSVALAFLGLSNFAVATIKFHTLGQILTGFFGISISSQIDFRTQFSELLINYLNRFTDLFISNFLPTNVFLGGLLALFTLYLVRKEKFILFCLLSNFPIFIFGGHTNAYANIGLVTPAILGVSLLLQKLSRSNQLIALMFVGLLIFSNLYATFKNSPLGQIALVIPNDMVLKNQLRLIDESYRLADGKEFSINSLTLPLWTNTTWAYLYSWYGKAKYGYVPSFYGHDQIGLLGSQSLKKIQKPLEQSFFIIEPQDGIPINFFNDEVAAENSRTKLLSETSYGSLKLQVRIPKSNEQ